MKVDAVSRSKLKKVIFSSTEPSSTNVLWAKPTGDRCDMFIFKNGSWVNIKDNEIDPLVKDYVDAYYAELNSKIDENSKQISLQSNDIKSKLESVEKSSKEMVSTESSRAEQIEGELKDKITAETNRATGEETKLDAKISSEISRATNAEKALDTKITTLNNTKQDKLVSGTNIKTVNDESILGEGNIKTAPDIWANVLSLEDTIILVDGKKVELPAYKSVIIKDFRSVEPLVDENNGGICKTDKIVRFDIHYNGKIVPMDKFSLNVFNYSRKEGKWIITQPDLPSLDVSCFDTSKMTSMDSMFKNQRQITTIDCSSFNTSNVTSMDSIFNYCSNLTRLHLQGWDTSKVTDMSNIFRNDPNLIQLDQNFNTSKIRTINAMFCNDGKLQNIDVSNWDVSSCEGFFAVFLNCHSLTKIDLSKWDTKNAKNFELFLSVCGNITSVNVSNFDLTHVTTINCIFNNDTLLSDITFGEGWGKNTATLILDLSTIASKANYKLSDNTYESMLTMYDRIANNLTNTFTIKFSSKHNIPEGWIDKMTARGYTISIV
nr:MAG TPA: protein of unknown function DUF285 [Crassvirales sp.]